MRQAGWSEALMRQACARQAPRGAWLRPQERCAATIAFLHSLHSLHFTITITASRPKRTRAEPVRRHAVRRTSRQPPDGQRRVRPAAAQQGGCARRQGLRKRQRRAQRRTAEGRGGGRRRLTGAGRRSVTTACQRLRGAHGPKGLSKEHSSGHPPHTVLCWAARTVHSLRDPLKPRWVPPLRLTLVASWAAGAVPVAAGPPPSSRSRGTPSARPGGARRDARADGSGANSTSSASSSSSPSAAAGAAAPQGSQASVRLPLAAAAWEGGLRVPAAAGALRLVDGAVQAPTSSSSSSSMARGDASGTAEVVGQRRGSDESGEAAEAGEARRRGESSGLFRGEGRLGGRPHPVAMLYSATRPGSDPPGLRGSSTSLDGRSAQPPIIGSSSTASPLAPSRGPKRSPYPACAPAALAATQAATASGPPEGAAAPAAPPLLAAAAQAEGAHCAP
jgi:hypothetical protein